MRRLAMAPKKKADAKAKGKAKEKTPEEKAAEEAKAKAAKNEEEAKALYEKFSVDDGSIIKLAGFADAIRAVNEKHDMCFTDDPGQLIRDQWKKTGGMSAKELTQKAFVDWFVGEFAQMVEDKAKEVQEAEAKREEEKKAKAAAQAARYTSDGSTWKLHVADVKDATTEAYKQGKVPVILDNSDNFKTETFYTYSGAYIIECKKMIMQKFSEKKPLEEVLEEARASFVEAAHCFKYGQTVVFRLANTAWDPTMFNSEAFPTLKLLDTTEWNKLFGPDNGKAFKDSPFWAMCTQKDDQTEHECMGINEQFRVLALSQFKEEEFKEHMSEKFPMANCQLIQVTDPA